MNTVNFSKKLDRLLAQPEIKGKHLFLHSCCAPCSSYVLEYLRSFFCITVFYYNPNITQEPEYRKRVEEQKRLIGIFNGRKDGYHIDIIEGDYEPEKFFTVAKGYEKCKEGGERCFRCYELRLRETALRAKEAGTDYFTTTLTISPLKNAQKLNEIGERLAGELGIPFLPSDFKKKNGYKRSVELSTEYELYRQDYCGCVFSKLERQAQKEQKLQEEQQSQKEQQLQEEQQTQKEQQTQEEQKLQEEQTQKEQQLQREQSHKEKDVPGVKKEEGGSVFEAKSGAASKTGVESGAAFKAGAESGAEPGTGEACV